MNKNMTQPLADSADDPWLWNETFELNNFKSSGEVSFRRKHTVCSSFYGILGQIVLVSFMINTQGYKNKILKVFLLKCLEKQRNMVKQHRNILKFWSRASIQVKAEWKLLNLIEVSVLCLLYTLVFSLRILCESDINDFSLQFLINICHVVAMVSSWIKKVQKKKKRKVTSAPMW